MTSRYACLDLCLILADIVKVLHLHLLSGRTEQRDELLGCQTQLRLESFAVHIAEHAAKEGTTFGVPGCLVKVTHDDEQTALTYLTLQHKAKLGVSCCVILYMRYIQQSMWAMICVWQTT